MSTSRASGGNMFIVKVDGTSAGKKKAILPGYMPDIVKITRLDSAASRFLGISGENGTGPGVALKMSDLAASANIERITSNGFTFREDGVEFGSELLNGEGTFLVEFIQDGYLGKPFVDMSATTTYAADGIPTVQERGQDAFDLRTNYETEVPWLFRVA